MKVSPAIPNAFPGLNEAQLEIIGHDEGPLLVIAGPGSGKTYSIVLRTMNLLLNKKAAPKEIVVCTFTEKAAYELRDRISSAAQKLDYKGDLSELKVSTIHGLCNKILTNHRHHTKLGNNYATLDELTQRLFLFEHFKEIFGDDDFDKNNKCLGKYSTKWSTIDGASNYFNKITEEMVDPKELKKSGDPFLKELAKSYEAYHHLLMEHNRVDFAHLQSLAIELLDNKEISRTITREIKYALVDEYQDTNYIQEQLLLKLTGKTGNLCVVGDEDQSLYRFRGATVRNILEFTQKVKDCKVVKLTTNYRSHRNIIKAYDKWMAEADWSNPDPKQPPFRYDKTIEPDPSITHSRYPSIFCIWGKDQGDEGERFAHLVSFLKRKNVIQDYNQVALLLHSVREDHSAHYIQALEAKGIPAYCPRARTYFENEEVKLMVACFALTFGWYEDGRGEVKGSTQELADYVDEGISELGQNYGDKHPLSIELRKFIDEIGFLKKDTRLDIRPADFFYRLLAVPPFSKFVENVNRARNMAMFSELLNLFQSYYHYTGITHRNREYMKFHLFNSFLRLLHDGGINDYEDPDQPFPKGYVQIMTVHQAKGLEFPVIVVGSLDKQLSTQKYIDRDLGDFYHRPVFEPEDRVTHFDRMRLHYVAFSRAEKILVLTGNKNSAIKEYFDPIWQGLPQWPYVDKEALSSLTFKPKERMQLKRSYSFSGDLTLYENCPRQYQFFREYNFQASRSAVIFFGLLVHQTIEEIHRFVLDDKLPTLTENRIRELFERTFRFLVMSDVRPISPGAKEAAFEQVMNYFRQNKKEMERIVETEVDVSVEKDDYILTGKVDLLLGGDGKLELLDFKTSPRPQEDQELLADYERQLCIYAHILEKRHGKRPERLYLYWTSEKDRANALMEFPFRPELVDEAGTHFDEVVKKIKNREFQVLQPPESGICAECDIKYYCAYDGVIKEKPPVAGRFVSRFKKRA